MRWIDLLGLPLSALWQQKSRTLLTTLGVMFGSFVLAASLSIGQGVQDTIDRESRRSDFLRKVNVHTNWAGKSDNDPADDEDVAGDMEEGKRERLRKALVARKSGKRRDGKVKRLTRESLATIGAIDHVEAVIPVIWQSGVATFEHQFQDVSIFSSHPNDQECRRRIVAGRFFNALDERAVVVSELFLYHCLITDDQALEGVLGSPLRLDLQTTARETGFSVSLVLPDGDETTDDQRAALEKIRERLPQTLETYELFPTELEAVQSVLRLRTTDVSPTTTYSEEFPIVGVYRLLTDEEEKQHSDSLRVHSDVVLPIETGTELFFRMGGNSSAAVDQVVVIADEEKNTIAVRDEVIRLGFNAWAYSEFIQRQRLTYLLIFGGMTCVAAVAMLVAALGIANTMLMSVLERTREIGIMKAVGAGNGQLVFLFLIEGGLIGTIGGILGLLLAHGAAIPGDAWVRSMVSRDMQIDLSESLFVFPPWLSLVVLTFAILVTTMAAVYPARRAARIDPVSALRHE